MILHKRLELFPTFIISSGITLSLKQREKHFLRKEPHQKWETALRKCAVDNVAILPRWTLHLKQMYVQ